MQPTDEPHDDLFDLFGDLVAFRPEGSGSPAAAKRACEAAELARRGAWDVAAE